MTKKSYSRFMAVTLAIMVAFTYSIPVTAFAGILENTAEVVKQGETVYYDKNGNSVNDFNSGVVELNKNIKKLSGDNEFEITVKVRTKDEVQTSSKSKDSATVLVMDLSSSMNEYDGDDTNRLTEAKNAALQFLDSYVKNAGDSKRELSIVVFASGAKRYLNWTDANDKNSQKGYLKIKKAIEDIEWGDVPQGGNTNIHGGLMLARNLWNVQNMSSILNKNVILLTDGVPNMYSNDSKSQDHIDGIDRFATDSYWYNDSFEDVPVICQQIKDLDSSIYSVCYGIEDKLVYKKSNKWVGNSHDWRMDTEEISINNWLNNRVKVTKNYSADNVDDLYNAFENISGNIEETISTSNLYIEDPMGEFITLEDQENLGENATFTGNKLKINLLDGEKKDGITSYTFSYKVKLNTTAQS
ncbi:MAG: VWA domain-containing protein, partial [Aminipila sp.]